RRIDSRRWCRIWRPRGWESRSADNAPLSPFPGRRGRRRGSRTFRPFRLHSTSVSDWIRTGLDVAALRQSHRALTNHPPSETVWVGENSGEEHRGVSDLLSGKTPIKARSIRPGQAQAVEVKTGQ